MGREDSAASANAPLAGWQFEGTFRRSQRAVFDAVGPSPVSPLHIVAPPGAGKTLVGLELARRAGSRAVALAPTTTIRSQWARAAAEMASAGSAGQVVSEDPQRPGDFTALTYQMLSVMEESSPFDDLARSEWLAELVEAGREPGAAEAWLSDLASSHRAAYLRGLRRRAGRLRKEIVRENPTALEAALHPNARALIARLVAHGVTTVVLDECHHLLDHWAIVVHCLLARIRERGVEPLVIGLTATLPSEDDRVLYENYTGLLGEVDYELPAPAVVKEGNLAPYRDFAWFVTPTQEELGFLRTQDRELTRLVETTLGRPDGIAFLEGELLPEGVLARESAPGGTTRTPEERVAAAFKADFAFSEAAARMLGELAPQHRVVGLVGPEASHRATMDQRIRVLARYALTCLLPDPEKAETWASVKAVLADFGYHLTDRGVRRGRDPVDQILATSVAKDYAVGEILRHELARDAGEEIRAVVLVDFAVYGHGAGARKKRAGALRCFEIVAADESIASLRPVLVTARHLRVAGRDVGDLVPRFEEITGVTPTVIPTDSPGVVELGLSGLGPSAIVAAVSQLVARGDVRLLVGTRGLLGEGWDCPAVNTLIDLSVAATSAATQQLRGRSLRLDTNWPEKVAHNWTVTSVVESGMKLDGVSDLARLSRKHERVWGIARDGTGAITRGLTHTLTRRQLSQLDAIAEKRSPAVRAVDVNRETLREFPARAETRRQWGIGEPYLGEQREALTLSPTARLRPFVSSLTLDIVLLLAGVGIVAIGLQLFRIGAAAGSLPLVAKLILFGGAGAVMVWGTRDFWKSMWLAVRQRALPSTAYHGAAFAIARVLHSRERIPEYGRGNIVVLPLYAQGMTVAHYAVEVHGGELADQQLILAQLEELLAPVRTPRFLLEVGQAPLRGRSAVSWLGSRIAELIGFRTRFLQVPTALGRRRADAQLFATEWGRHVGPCTLHEIDSPDKLALLTRARQRSAAPGTRTGRREVWA